MESKIVGDIEVQRVKFVRRDDSELHRSWSSSGRYWDQAKGKEKGNVKGKGKGKGPAPIDSPFWERKKASERRMELGNEEYAGRVVKYAHHQSYGYIEPDDKSALPTDVQTNLAQRHNKERDTPNGIYFRAPDVLHEQGVTRRDLGRGDFVTFKLYLDARGVGAFDVKQDTQPERQAMQQSPPQVQSPGRSQAEEWLRVPFSEHPAPPPGPPPGRSLADAGVGQKSSQVPAADESGSLMQPRYTDSQRSQGVYPGQIVTARFAVVTPPTGYSEENFLLPIYTNEAITVIVEEDADWFWGEAAEGRQGYVHMSVVDTQARGH